MAADPSRSAPSSSSHASAIDHGTLAMSQEPFPDFTGLSQEQLDMLVNGALAADPSALAAVASGLGAASHGHGPAPMLLPMTGSMSTLPTQFDFGSHSITAGLMDANMSQPANAMLSDQHGQVLQPSPQQHQQAFAQLAPSQPQAASALARRSPTGLSAAGIADSQATLLGASTLPHQPLMPSMTSPLAVSQAATAAGWQVFATQAPAYPPTAATTTSAAFVLPLLHLSQTVPQNHQHSALHHLQTSSAPHLSQQHLLQQQQIQQTQLQQQQQHHQQLQSISSLPQLQHHHSFHHLPVASSQSQPELMFGQADASNLSPIDAHSHRFQDQVNAIDHQLQSHQSLGNLPLHFQGHNDHSAALQRTHLQHHASSSLFMSGADQSTIHPHTPSSSVVSAGSTTTSVAGGIAAGYASGSSAAGSSLGGLGHGGGLLSPTSVSSMPILHGHTSTGMQGQGGSAGASTNSGSMPSPLTQTQAQQQGLSPLPPPTTSSSGKSAVRSRPKRSVSAGMVGGHAKSMSTSTAAAASLLGGSRLLVPGSSTSGFGMVGGSGSSSSTTSSLSQPLRDILSSSNGRALLEEAARVRNERVQKYDEVSAALDTLRLYFKQSSRRSGGGSSSSSAGGSSLSGRNPSSVNQPTSGGHTADSSFASSSSSSKGGAGTGLTSPGRSKPTSGTPAGSHVIGLGLGFASSSSSSHPHRSRNASGSTGANTSGSRVGNSSVISALSSGTMASSSSTNASSLRSDVSRHSSLAPSASSLAAPMNSGIGGVVGPGSASSSLVGSPARSHGHGHARTRSRRASSSLHRSFSGEVKSTISEPAAAGHPYPSPYAHLHAHGHHGGGKAHGFLHGHSHRSTGALASPGRGAGAGGDMFSPDGFMDAEEDGADGGTQGAGSGADDDQRLDVLDDISERVSRMKEEVQRALAHAAAVAAAEGSVASSGGGASTYGHLGDGTAGHDLVEPPG